MGDDEALAGVGFGGRFVGGGLRIAWWLGRLSGRGACEKRARCVGLRGRWAAVRPMNNGG